MTDQTHVSELLPGYALECLDADDASKVTKHLATCATCRAELRAYYATVERLALASPTAVPPPALKHRLMSRIRPQPLPELATPWWRALVAGFRQSAPVWGTVSLALVVVLAALNILLWQQLLQHRAVSTATRITVVPMNGTDGAPNASGIIAISSDGEYGSLVVQGLPPLTPEQQYQLWLIRDGQRTSGALFSVNDHGYVATLIVSPLPLSNYSAFGVTIEPTGGSPAPTGPRVLSGSL
jgi:anti-sigma-K factor RskA